jgi:hypothetical protein
MMLKATSRATAARSRRGPTKCRNDETPTPLTDTAVSITMPGRRNHAPQGPALARLPVPRR